MPIRANRRPLTERQAAVLKYIRSSIAKRGIPPSGPEIRKHLNLSADSVANQVLWALEHKGYITTKPGMTRSIKLIEAPKRKKSK